MYICGMSSLGLAHSGNMNLAAAGCRVVTFSDKIKDVSVHFSFNIYSSVHVQKCETYIFSPLYTYYRYSILNTFTDRPSIQLPGCHYGRL
jgi:hypothetical protein